MNISDGAVDAARRELATGAYQMAPGELPYADAARRAIEAAAPHLASQWHDAVSAAYVEGSLSAEAADVMYKANPYRAAGAGEE